jgi:hypothetical protein
MLCFTRVRNGIGICHGKHASYVPHQGPHVFGSTSLGAGIASHPTRLFCDRTVVAVSLDYFVYSLKE